MKKLVLFSVFISFVGSGAYAGGGCPYDVRGGKLTACGSIPPTGGAAGGCTSAQVSAHEDCASRKTGASVAECISNGGANSCAALECDSDHLLYTTLYNNAGKRRKEIEVVGTNLSDIESLYVGEKVGSQGLCRSRKDLEMLCSNSCACDDPSEQCVLNEVTVRNRKKYGETGKKDVQAFIGEEVCVCVPDPNYEPPVPPVSENCETKYAGNQARIQCCKWAEEDEPKKAVHWNEDTNSCECVDRNLKLNMDTGECYSDDDSPDIEGDCRYTFQAAVVCNGKRVFKFTSFRISKEMAKSLKLPSCRPGENVTIEERYKEDVANFNKLRDEVCGKPGNIFDVTYDDNDTEYLDAKNRIDAFMRNADLNKNVWKNEEGKFNTSRLASDLTAGVVLGTVGGIVSANVIKKKQIEKGFDALNCTVGGQKVAGWGDVFNVGLRRY